MSKEAPETAAPLPGKNPSGKKGLIVGIAVALVAAAGGGGAAYWKWGMAAASAAAHGAPAAHAAPAEVTDPGMVPFEPFLVNLADEGGQAFLRVTLNVLVASEEDAKALEGKPVVRTRMRSAVLEVLSTQTAARLVTPEGKAELKAAIAAKIDSLKLQVRVHDVLFSDFVVQQ
jgi:flagellar FliL protein